MSTKDLDFIEQKDDEIMNIASSDLQTETSASASSCALDLKVDGRDDPTNLSLSAVKTENLGGPEFCDEFFSPVSSILPLSTGRSSTSPLTTTSSTPLATTSSTAPSQVSCALDLKVDGRDDPTNLSLSAVKTENLGGPEFSDEFFSPVSSILPLLTRRSSAPPLTTTSSTAPLTTASSTAPLTTAFSTAPLTTASSTAPSQVETPLISKPATDGRTNGLVAKKKQVNLQRTKEFVVLNLGPDLTKQELLTYFKQFGPVQSIEVQKYPDGTSKEYALVRFKSTESTLKVLGKTHQIGSRRCTVRFPNPAYAQTQYVLSVQGNIAGLTFEDLWVYFATYGLLFDIYIPHPNNGVCYLITTRENVAIDLSGKYHTIKDVSVYVKFRNAMFINGRYDMGNQPNTQQTNCTYSFNAGWDGTILNDLFGW